MDITINYTQYSAHEQLRGIGGAPNGQLTVNENKAATIGNDVKNDMENGRTKEDKNSAPYKTIDEWVARSDKGYNPESVTETKNQATASIVTKDGNTAVNDTSEEGDGKNSGGQGGTAAGAGIAAALQSLIVAEKLAMVPWMAIVAGGIMTAAGGTLLALARNYDKEDLAARQSFRSEAGTYVQTANDKQAAITAWKTTQEEERTAAMQTEADQAGAATEDLIAQLEALDSQYFVDFQSATSKDQRKELKKAYEAQRAALLNGGGGIDEVFERMGEVLNKGYDELYTMFGEADGLKAGYDLIATFLKIGTNKGNAATWLAIADTAAAALMLGSIGYMLLAGIGPLSKIQAIAGGILAAVGAGLAGGAAGVMFKKASEEFKCGDEGVIVETNASGTLEKAVEENKDLDSTLQANLEGQYALTGGEIQDAFNDAAENGGSSAVTSSEDGETVIATNGINGGTGRNVGENANGVTSSITPPASSGGNSGGSSTS